MKKLQLIIFTFFAFSSILVFPTQLQAMCRNKRDGACTAMFIECPTTNTCCQNVSECPKATGCQPGLGGVELGDCLQLSDSSKVQDVYTSPSFLVNLLVDNVFVAAGIMIFFLTLLAGFFFITGGKKGLDQGKQILLAVLVGFGLMLAAYWVVQLFGLIFGLDVFGQIFK